MVLVTGGTGFLGSYLIRSLVSRGFTVRAIHRKHADRTPLQDLRNIEWIECDVRDPYGLEDAMTNVRTVYHNAAVVAFDSRKRKTMYSVNVDGTSNVVDTALRCGVRKLVHVSSIAALGRLKPGELITEQTSWAESRYNSEYGRSKYYAELQVWRGMAEGLNAVIVNPGVILGTWKWNKLSAKFFARAWKNQPFYTNGVNGFVDVRDCAELTIRLGESDISNERFVLISENWSYQQLFTRIAELLHRKPPRFHARNWMLRAIGASEWIRSRATGSEPMINAEIGRFGNQQFFYSAGKVSDVLSFRFRSIEETLRDTATVFLQQQQTGQTTFHF
jgi:nucleoside-diphosphate-sugar epimerase